MFCGQQQCQRSSVVDRSFTDYGLSPGAGHARVAAYLRCFGKQLVTAATIRSLENRWATAIKNHDTKALEVLLADDFEGTSSSGLNASKRRLVSLLRRDKNVYTSCRVRGMAVCNIASGKAVVSGVATESGFTESGSEV